MPKSVLRKLPLRIDGHPETGVAWWDIDTGRDGPCLLVNAAMHGTELQGCDPARRFRAVAEREMVRGRLLLVPFTNPIALRARRGHTRPDREIEPGSRRHNIVLVFPGDPRGTDAEQVAHALLEGIFRPATHCIDLHCYLAQRVTAVFANEDEKVLDFARAGAFPLIHVGQRLGRNTEKPLDDTPGTLDTWFNSNGRLGFTVEFSGQGEVTGSESDRGLRALVNCARYLGIMEGPLEGLEEPLFIRDAATRETRIEAPAAGLFIKSLLAPGDTVAAGQLLGVIFDDTTLESVEVRSPRPGFLLQFGRYAPENAPDFRTATHPYADRGDLLALVLEK